MHCLIAVRALRLHTVPDVYRCNIVIFVLLLSYIELLLRVVARPTDRTTAVGVNVFLILASILKYSRMRVVSGRTFGERV